MPDDPHKPAPFPRSAKSRKFEFGAGATHADRGFQVEHLLAQHVGPLREGYSKFVVTIGLDAAEKLLEKLNETGRR